MITNNNLINVPLTIIALLFSASACSNPSTVNTDTTTVQSEASDSSATEVQADGEKPEFTTKTLTSFDEPWAMTALPKSDNESRKLLVTQKAGELFIVDTATGNKTKVSGVPKVAYGGQGGLGDLILAMDTEPATTAPGLAMVSDTVALDMAVLAMTATIPAITPVTLRPIPATAQPMSHPAAFCVVGCVRAVVADP